MSEDGSDMSEEELDGLLDDLKSRADEGETAGPESKAEGEDLDEFFEELDQEHGADDQRDDVQTKAPDPSSGDGGPDLSEFEGLEAGDDGESASTSLEKTDGDEPASTEAASEEGGGSASGADSQWGRRVLLVVKWVAYLLPVAVLWWVVGSFLQQWVRPEAVFMVPVLASVFAVGLPLLLYRAAGNRGRLRWWYAGTGLVLTLGLTAPMPKTAGSVLGEYGHWPSVAVADALGLEGGVLEGANKSLAGAVGGLLTPDPGESKPLGESAGSETQADRAPSGDE